MMNRSPSTRGELLHMLRWRRGKVLLHLLHHRGASDSGTQRHAGFDSQGLGGYDVTCWMYNVCTYICILMYIMYMLCVYIHTHTYMNIHICIDIKKTYLYIYISTIYVHIHTHIYCTLW